MAEEILSAAVLFLLIACPHSCQIDQQIMSAEMKWAELILWKGAEKEKVGGKEVQPLRQNVENIRNPFSDLLPSLGLHSVTNGKEDRIFTDFKDYKIGFTGELGVHQGTTEWERDRNKGIREWVDQKL